MRVYHAKELEDAPNTLGRTHPWLTSTRSEEEKYYDFISDPDLIETSLEDFVPWASYQAIQTFYEFLRWANSSASVFETNDSAFSGPHKNSDEWVKKSVRVRGRVMLFFRRPELNLLTALYDSLAVGLYKGLIDIDKSFELGVIGITRYPTYFKRAKVLEFLRQGYVVTLSFWAWGDTNDEVMQNLERLLTNLHDVVQELSKRFESLKDLVLVTSMPSNFQNLVTEN